MAVFELSWLRNSTSGSISHSTTTNDNPFIYVSQTIQTLVKEFCPCLYPWCVCVRMCDSVSRLEEQWCQLANGSCVQQKTLLGTTLLGKVIL